MKKSIIFLAVLGVLCVFARGSLAAPYLVCDPYPADSQPTRFEVTVDGTAQQVPYTLHATGAAIVLDLAGLSDGPHQVTAIKACNERGCSSEAPLFSVPGKPSSIGNLRMAP